MATIQDFMQFEFRVAEVLDVREHPDADRLYVLDVQVGEDDLFH